jgi:hypothetical protein
MPQQYERTIFEALFAPGPSPVELLGEAARALEFLTATFTGRPTWKGLDNRPLRYPSHPGAMYLRFSATYPLGDPNPQFASRQLMLTIWLSVLPSGDRGSRFSIQFDDPFEAATWPAQTRSVRVQALAHTALQAIADGLDAAYPNRERWRMTAGVWPDPPIFNEPPLNANDVPPLETLLNRAPTLIRTENGFRFVQPGDVLPDIRPDRPPGHLFGEYVSTRTAMAQIQAQIANLPRDVSSGPFHVDRSARDHSELADECLGNRRLSCSFFTLVTDVERQDLVDTAIKALLRFFPLGVSRYSPSQLKDWTERRKRVVGNDACRRLSTFIPIVHSSILCDGADPTVFARVSDTDHREGRPLEVSFAHAAGWEDNSTWAIVEGAVNAVNAALQQQFGAPPLAGPCSGAIADMFDYPETARSVRTQVPHRSESEALNLFVSALHNQWELHLHLQDNVDHVFVAEGGRPKNKNMRLRVVSRLNNGQVELAFNFADFDLWRSPVSRQKLREGTETIGKVLHAHFPRSVLEDFKSFYTTGPLPAVDCDKLVELVSDAIGDEWSLDRSQSGEEDTVLSGWHETAPLQVTCTCSPRQNGSELSIAVLNIETACSQPCVDLIEQMLDRVDTALNQHARTGSLEGPVKMPLHSY